jgi:hypothetical protein
MGPLFFGEKTVPEWMFASNTSGSVIDFMGGGCSPPHPHAPNAFDGFAPFETGGASERLGRLAGTPTGYTRAVRDL